MGVPVPSGRNAQGLEELADEHGLETRVASVEDPVARAVIVPDMAFFGGLGDLPATAAMGDRTEADEAHIAYALSSRHPTAGTRLSGAVSRERRGDHRLRYSGGQWEHRSDQPPILVWTSRIRWDPGK